MGGALIWALRLGIKLARQLQLHNVILEMDSLLVVNMVNLGVTMNANFKPLLEDIITELRLLDWRPTITHVYREANRCADHLAKQGLQAATEWVLIDVASPLLGMLLADDSRGSCLPPASCVVFLLFWLSSFCIKKKSKQ